MEYINWILPVVAAVISYPLGFLSIRLALRWGVLDIPNARKINQKPIPRLGGLSFSIAFILIMAGVYLSGLRQLDCKEILLLGGGIIILLLGIWDDFKNISPKTKFAVQFLVAISITVWGVHFDSITNPFSGNSVELGFLGYILTVFWIVGVTNAVNLLDGLDGLAAGTSLITLLAIASIGAYSGNQSVALPALILAGAILGFLPLNFNPARTFMGDSGSLFLGYMLAILALMSSTLGPAAFTIFIPMTILGLPIFDTLFSMFRRLATGHKPFDPDKGHIHHRLLSKGLSQKQAVLIIYTLSILFCIGAFFIVASRHRIMAGVLLIYVIGIAYLVRWLGTMSSVYKHRNKRYEQQGQELAERGYRERTQMTRLFRFLTLSAWFRFVLDILGFVASWTIPVMLIENVPAFWQPGFRDTLPLFLGGLIISMTLLQRPSARRLVWRYITSNQMVRFIQAALLGSMLPYFFAPLILTDYDIPPIVFFVLQGLFFMFWILSSRLVLNFYYHLLKRRNYKYKEGEKVLIYGAGDSGEQLLRTLIQYEWLHYRVVGFIDDDPRKQKQLIQDCPVLGTTADLQKICEENGIDRLLVSCTIPKKRRKNFFFSASAAGVPVSQLQVQLVDLLDANVMLRHPGANPMMKDILI